MTALRSFRSCLKRQVNEAVRISSSQADILLKSKSEFHQVPLIRLKGWWHSWDFMVTRESTKQGRPSLGMEGLVQ